MATVLPQVRLVEDVGDGDARLAAYRAKMDSLMDDHGKLVEKRIADAQSVLLKVDQQVADTLINLPTVPDGSAFRADSLRQIRREIETQLTVMEAEFNRIAFDGLNDSWDAGVGFSGDSLKGAGIDVGSLPSVSRAQLDVIVQQTGDAITAVTAETRKQLARTVNMGIVAQRTPFEIRREVAGILKGTGRVGNGPIFAQTERLVRTEMNGTFAIADELRTRDIADAQPELRKWWDATRDSRTRPSHVHVENQTRPGEGGEKGGTIPAGVWFRVGGVRGRFPLDPRLPPQERINCRCVRGLWHEDWFTDGPPAPPPPDPATVGAPEPATVATAPPKTKRRRAKKGEGPNDRPWSKDPDIRRAQDWILDKNIANEAWRTTATADDMVELGRMLRPAFENKWKGLKRRRVQHQKMIDDLAAQKKEFDKVWDATDKLVDTASDASDRLQTARVLRQDAERKLNRHNAEIIGGRAEPSASHLATLEARVERQTAKWQKAQDEFDEAFAALNKSQKIRDAGIPVREEALDAAAEFHDALLIDRANLHTEIISEVRGVGGGKVRWRAKGNSRPGKQSVNNAVKRLPDDWVEAASANQYPLQVSYAERGSMAQNALFNPLNPDGPGMWRMNISQRNRSLLADTAEPLGAFEEAVSIHEYTHYLEKFNPHMKRLREEFHIKRAKGDMGKVFPNGETYVVDEYVNKYMGRVYDEFTVPDLYGAEIPTMGNEMVLGRDYGFALEDGDMEMFDFIVGMLIGI